MSDDSADVKTNENSIKKMDPSNSLGTIDEEIMKPDSLWKTVAGTAVLGGAVVTGGWLAVVGFAGFKLLAVGMLGGAVVGAAIGLEAPRPAAASKPFEYQ